MLEMDKIKNQLLNFPSYLFTEMFCEKHKKWYFQEKHFYGSMLPEPLSLKRFVKNFPFSE